MLTTNPTGVWAFRNHTIDTVNVSNSCGDATVNWSLSATAWPSANLAVYVPVRVKAAGVVTSLVLPVSTSSGNFDIGLYNSSGTRLVSSGSTAMSGTNTEQVVDVTDTAIGFGLFYLALCMDNTTATMRADLNAAPYAAAAGVLTEALGSVVLPSTATWAVNQTLAYVPPIAMLFTTVVT